MHRNVDYYTHISPRSTASNTSKTSNQFPLVSEGAQEQAVQEDSKQPQKVVKISGEEKLDFEMRS